MLSELGPFYPTRDGAHLLPNAHAWNKGSETNYSYCQCLRLVFVSS